MKKEKIIIISVLVLIFIFISFYFDDILVKQISFLRNDVLNNFFLGVTFIGSSIMIFFILTALFLWWEHKRRWILPLWICLGISSLVSLILKFSIQRARPFQTGIVSLLPSLQEASYSIWNFSFPSSHAMIAFCAIPILSEQFPKLKNLWIIFAVLVAFSRIYFGLHFVSDILTGGAIGYLIGVIILKLEKEEKFGQKIYDKIFKK